MRTTSTVGKVSFIAVALAVFLFAAGPMRASAQTVAVGELTGPIDLSNPANATARVKRLSGEAGASAIDKYLQGAVRIVPGVGGDGPQVSIEWFGLSSDAGGGDTISLSPAMTTKQQPSGITIPGGQEMAVSGDVGALVRAAQTITENAAAQGEEETTEEGETASTLGSSDSSPTSAGAGAALENTDAELPTIQGVTATETVETVVNNDVYGETTEGCTPEISEDGTYVTIFKATTTNGVKTGECATSLETATVQKTYIGCGYDTTSDETKAFATSRRYYTYGGSSTDVDTECVKEEETSFAITESPDGCKVVPDLDTLVASQQMAKVFVGRENERVVVTSCATSETGPTFPISFELCAYRDDFPNDKTYETHIATYVGPDGLKRNIGNCTDSGKVYVQFKDTSVCSLFQDLTANKLYEQYRVRIDLPTGPNFRTPSCKPFSTALTDLQETQAGCESFHTDFAGYSLGGKRIIRQDNGQQVRECRVSDVRYDHVYVAEGWVTDDANLQAKAKDATYIDLPQPAGRTLVAAAAVRDGTAPTPYIFQSEALENGGTEYIPNACEKYVKQKKMRTYKRPDGSLFTRQEGFGPSIGPTNDCVTTYSPTWTRHPDDATVSHNYIGYNESCPPTSNGRWAGSARYQGVKTVTRGDGAQISQDTGTVTHSQCSQIACGIPWHTHPSPWVTTPACPASTSNGTLISSWRATLGWN